MRNIFVRLLCVGVQQVLSEKKGKRLTLEDYPTLPPVPDGPFRGLSSC